MDFCWVFGGFLWIFVGIGEVGIVFFGCLWFFDWIFWWVGWDWGLVGCFFWLIWGWLLSGLGGIGVGFYGVLLGLGWVFMDSWWFLCGFGMVFGGFLVGLGWDCVGFMDHWLVSGLGLGWFCCTLLVAFISFISFSCLSAFWRMTLTLSLGQELSRLQTKLIWLLKLPQNQRRLETVVRKNHVPWGRLGGTVEKGFNGGKWEQDPWVFWLKTGVNQRVGDFFLGFRGFDGDWGW